MESDKIEKLLDRYFDATTTASEEAALRTYFSQDRVAKHLQHYVPMFRYFAQAKEERFTKQVPLKLKTKSSKKFWYSLISVAAVVMLLIGVYFNLNTPTSSGALEDEYTQAEIDSAQEALSLLAINFNKGSEQLSYLEEFEKNTNRFLNEEKNNRPFD